MKKLFALVAATAMVGAGSAASAVSITPNGPSVADGTVTLTQRGVTVTCNKSQLKGTVSGGVAKITSATFASSDSNFDGACKTAKGTFPWTVTATSTTAGKATNVSFTSVLGSCSGTLNGAYSNGTNTLSFNNQTLSGSPSNCVLSGSFRTHDNALIIR